MKYLMGSKKSPLRKQKVDGKLYMIDLESVKADRLMTLFYLK